MKRDEEIGSGGQAQERERRGEGGHYTLHGAWSMDPVHIDVHTDVYTDVPAHTYLHIP